MSPSVTATWRMLSPKRATLSVCASCQPHAARAQVPIRSTTAGSLQCPTTVLRLSRIRVSMNPNSRSPCADWFRFMKSMSISDHGRSRLNCVCRWSSGFCSAPSPRSTSSPERRCASSRSRRRSSQQRSRRDRAGGSGPRSSSPACARPGPGRPPPRRATPPPPGSARRPAQHSVAVELLASRDEPDFERVERFHDQAPIRPVTCGGRRLDGEEAARVDRRGRHLELGEAACRVLRQARR